MIASFYVDARGALSSLQRSRLQTRAMLQDFTGDESDELLDLMKEHAPKRSGQFAAGLRRWRRPAAVRQNRVQIDLVAGGRHAFLASMILEGTRPHMIRSIRPMPITYGGEPVGFAHTVHHPGTSPNDFVRRAVGILNRRLRSRASSRVRRLSMVRG
ncbi:hypothetical protein ACFLXE_00105 [Chloroflexota bacterium]